MEVDILHTTHLPGKLFQSLQKYPRLENKFRSPGGSKLDHKTLQYVRSSLIESIKHEHYTTCGDYGPHHSPLQICRQVT